MLKRILREPLLHFTVIGLALFVVFKSMNNDPAPLAANEIVISPAAIERLISTFQAVRHRNPDAGELEALVQDQILEEVLVREAKQLGLDQNDTVVRRRLRTKMEFLTAAAAESLVPTPQELQTHFTDNADTYRLPASLAFSQVYLGQRADDAFVATILQELQNGVPARTLGQPTLLPPRVPLTQARTIDSNFGMGFFEQIWPLDNAMWQGPVISGYGLHLIRVEDRKAAELPDLEQVESRVLADWKQDTADKVSKQTIALLKEKYIVQRPAPQTLQDLLK